MKKRILLCAVAAILAAGAGFFGYDWFFKPQVLTFDDGTTLTLLATTYGKHHVCPETKVNGHRVHAGKFDTTNDSLCLWLLQKQVKNFPNFQMFVYDPDKIACGASSETTYGNQRRGGIKENVVGVLFEAFPRRAGKLHFRASTWDQGGQDMIPGEIVVSNPARGSNFDLWIAQPLPCPAQEGDLEATLTHCEIVDSAFGAPNSDQDDTDAHQKGVKVSFSVTQNGKAVSNWKPVAVETSDATGNRARMWSWSNQRNTQEEQLTYQWGLWPDEPAWKFRVEMSQQSGFAPEDLWTIPGVTLVPGKMNDTFRGRKNLNAFAERNIGDIHVKIFSGVRLSEQEKRNRGNMDAILLITADPATNGVRVTLVSVTDDKNQPVDFNDWGSGGIDHRFSLMNLGDATNLNVTVAVHRSRFFEYTVKPTKSSPSS